MIQSKRYFKLGLKYAEKDEAEHFSQKITNTEHLESFWNGVATYFKRQDNDRQYTKH